MEIASRDKVLHITDADLNLIFKLWRLVDMWQLGYLSQMCQGGMTSLPTKCQDAATNMRKEDHLKLHRVEPVVVWPLSMVTQLALIASERVQQGDGPHEAWQLLGQQVAHCPLVCQNCLDVMQDTNVGLACTQ